jgi:hypothetical protein
MARMGVAGRWAVSLGLLAALACSETGKPDDGTAGRGGHQGTAGATGGTVTTGGGGIGAGCPQGGQFTCGCTAAPNLAVCVNGQWTCQSGIPLSACDPCAQQAVPAPGCVCHEGQWTCSTGGSGGSAGSGGGGSGGATACSSVTTLDACDARGDCHAVFQDPGTCGCAGLGCCARFSRCAAGERADCTPDGIACEMATPHCESPYTVSYTGVCYEGCVRASECMGAP